MSAHNHLFLSHKVIATMKLFCVLEAWLDAWDEEEEDEVEMREERAVEEKKDIMRKRFFLLFTCVCLGNFGSYFHPFWSN